MVKGKGDNFIYKRINVGTDHLTTDPAKQISYLVMIVEGTQVIVISSTGGGGLPYETDGMLVKHLEVQPIKTHNKVLVRAIVTFTLLE